VFGDSDETFHAHSGSDSFTTELSKLLGDRVKLDARLTRVVRAGTSFRITLETRAGFAQEVTADRVVFALPFSVLRHVDLADLEVSPEKRKAIAELGYGTNTKLIGAFKTRIWRDVHKKSGSVTSDLPLQQAWDGSIGQVEAQVATSQAQGTLTNFLGGRAGARPSSLLPDGEFRAALSDLKQVFPGVETEYIAGSARRMHWPSSAFFRGSYTCYRPGQWAFSGSEGKREGNLHFCGEHCSVDFQGFMEGAAETGALVAAEILDDLEIEKPTKLASIVTLKTVVPQPCYGSGPLQHLGRRARARLVASAHTLAVADWAEASSQHGA
jgi:monoamine oxidase